jgi:tryptophan synthase beta chain
VRYSRVSDDEALAAFETLCRTEGIVPALESAHAIAFALSLAAKMPRSSWVLVNLSGRGDKDLAEYERIRERSGGGSRKAERGP